MVNVREIISSKNPSFFRSYPKLFADVSVSALSKIVKEREINEFLSQNKELEGFDFIDAVLEKLNFTYKFSSRSKENIPSSGKLIIIANHPLGALDALSLIRFVREVRSDVKVVANDLLLSIPNLKSLLLGLDITKKASVMSDMKAILSALKNEEAVIIFPAGEVSRARPVGIRDTRWESGFLFLAEKAKAPILPVFIKAKNSFVFYAASTVYKPLGMLLLPTEMMRQKNKSLEFVVGESIPATNVTGLKISKEEKVKLVRKHLYRVAKNKKGVFATERNVAHPEERKSLRDELAGSELLGKTADDKMIYLYDYAKKSTILKEVGRLREATFRKVGEGTGRQRDTDEYDKYYRHIVLWDDKELEIVGAYRIGQGREIYDIFGKDGFYTNSLFSFCREFEELLPHSIELGRSFVQSKYWGSRALDYLWYGIGAYLKKHGFVKYMFGPVSLSNSYPDEAKKLIIYFYSKYFPAPKKFATSKNPFVISKNEEEEFSSYFSFDNYDEDFRKLKNLLKNYGSAVPVLFKQYSELCEKGGVYFSDFGVDPDFGDCVDGFIIVEIDKILSAKRERYMGDLS